MEENRLDKIIENSIKNASMEVDVRQPVMERIVSYRMKAVKRWRIIIILSSIYTVAASLVFLVLLHKISQFSIPLVPRLPICVSTMKIALQGVFVFIPAFLLITGLYYWLDARKDKLKINRLSRNIG